MLGFNDTSTSWVILCRLPEKERKETEEITAVPVHFNFAVIDGVMESGKDMANPALPHLSKRSYNYFFKVRL